VPLPEDLTNRFTYHPPMTEQQGKVYDTIRGAGFAFARVVNELAPESMELVIAIRKIEEAVMWANAAVARNST